MTLHTLEDLLARHLRLMLSMEHQADDAFAWLSNKTAHPKLGNYLATYRDQARDRLSRLGDCFHLLSREAVPLFCPATAAIMDEARQTMEMPVAPGVRPVMLTSTLRHFAQFQVSVSLESCDWADRLGRAETVLLLQQGLAEQKAMAQKLSHTAEEVEQVAPLAA